MPKAKLPAAKEEITGAQRLHFPQGPLPASVSVLSRKQKPLEAFQTQVIQQRFLSAKNKIVCAMEDGMWKLQEAAPASNGEYIYRDNSVRVT